MRLIVSGSLAYDRIMEFDGKFEDHILPDKLHMLNVSFPVKGVRERFGGTAGNIAYNLVLLGEKPLIVASAGTDFERYRDRLHDLGLSLAGIRQVSAELTAGAYIVTDRNHNQITAFNPGAMQVGAGYTFAPPPDEDTLAIVAPGSLDDMLACSRYYKKHAIAHIFDPGQAIPILSAEDLTEMTAGTLLLICNAYELEMIQQKTGLDEEALLQRTTALITTRGKDGSVLRSDSRAHTIGTGKPRRVVDPTGAGDAYRAGLLAGLARKKSLFESACMGACCASFAVEETGTQEHRFPIEDYKRRLQDHFGVSL